MAKAVVKKARNRFINLFLCFPILILALYRLLHSLLKLLTKGRIGIDLGVGEVDIYGMVGDLEIEVGVGDVDVQIAEKDVRSVRLDVGVGGADLRPRLDDVASSGFLFLGKEVEWRHGHGHSRVMVDVGVGEVEVRLN